MNRQPLAIFKLIERCAQAIERLVLISALNDRIRLCLRFVFDQRFNSAAYLTKIQEFAKRSNLLHIEPSGDGKFLSLTYDMTLRDGANAEGFAREFGSIEGVAQTTLIASKNDVDF